MLTALRTQTVERGDLQVVYNVHPGVVIGILADLVLKHDPYFRPMASWKMIREKGQLVTALNALYQAVTQPAAYGMGAKEDVARWEAENADWIIIADSLGLGVASLRQRARLSATEGDDLRAILEDMRLWNGGQLEIEDKTKYDLMTPENVTEDEHAFAFMALSFAWEKIIQSKYLVNVPIGEGEFKKAERARLIRAQRLAGLYIACVASYRVAALKAYSRLANLESIKARIMTQWTGYGEELVSELHKAANLPVHPWLAAADGLTLPGRALTPWAASSPVLGLPQSLFEAVRPKLGKPGDPLPSIERAAMLARDLNRSLEVLRSTPDAAFDGAATVLGFTNASTRINLGLYGAELRVNHCDGLSCTQNFSSPLELYSMITLPVQLAAGTPWVGRWGVTEYQDGRLGSLNTKATTYLEPA